MASFSLRKQVSRVTPSTFLSSHVQLHLFLQSLSISLHKAASCRRTKSERGIFIQKTMATGWSREISYRSAKTRCKIPSSACGCSLLAVCVNLSCLFKKKLGLICFRGLVFFLRILKLHFRGNPWNRRKMGALTVEQNNDSEYSISWGYCHICFDLDEAESGNTDKRLHPWCSTGFLWELKLCVICFGVLTYGLYILRFLGMVICTCLFWRVSFTLLYLNLFSVAEHALHGKAPQQQNHHYHYNHHDHLFFQIQHPRYPGQYCFHFSSGATIPNPAGPHVADRGTTPSYEG